MSIINPRTWQLVSSEADFSDLKSDWENLFDQNPAHSPFLAWGWVDAWRRHIAVSHEPRILCWRDGSDELQFILPLAAQKGTRKTRYKKIVNMCGYGAECSDHLGCLRLPMHDSNIAAIAASAIETFIGKHDRVELNFLADDKNFPLKLKTEMQDQGRIVRFASDAICPAVSLPGSWDEYLQQFSSNFRSQIRRYYKRISAQENLNFRSVDVVDAGEFTRNLIRQNRSRMSDKGTVSSLENEAFRNFLLEAVPYMAKHNYAWMDVVEEDGVVVGSALNLVHGDSVYYYMGGFDENAKKLRPGIALFALVINRSIDRNYAIYDFLRGLESYKYRWGAKDVYTHRLNIYPNSLVGGPVAWAVDGAVVGIRSFVRYLRK